MVPPSTPDRLLFGRDPYRQSRGEPVVILLDSFPHRRVRQTPVGGDHVVDEELHALGTWDHTGHTWMRREVLEEELGPGRHRELRSPRRQLLALHPLERAAAAEGGVDEHGHAAIGGERKDALLDVARVDRVIDLDEVERLLAHQLLERVVLPRKACRRADVTETSRLLHLAE